MKPHENDDDCTVDPVTMDCKVCHVYHGGDECNVCGGVAFHEPECALAAPPDSIEQDLNEARTIIRRICDALESHVNDLQRTMNLRRETICPCYVDEIVPARAFLARIEKAVR